MFCVSYIVLGFSVCVASCGCVFVIALWSVCGRLYVLFGVCSSCLVCLCVFVLFCRRVVVCAVFVCLFENMSVFLCVCVHLFLCACSVLPPCLYSSLFYLVDVFTVCASFGTFVLYYVFVVCCFGVCSVCVFAYVFVCLSLLCVCGCCVCVLV